MTEPDRSPSPAGAVAVAVLLALALAAGLTPYFEPDVWWHLHVGDWVTHTHQLTGWDPSAPLASRPFVATQWLPEVVTSAAYHWVGMAALTWLRAAAILVLVALMYARCRQASGRLAAACASTVALVGAAGGLNPRPQLVSFVITALMLWLLGRTSPGDRARWWLVPLFWVWACCHGLWTFGLLILAVTLVTEHAESPRPRRRSWARPVALLTGCVAVVALTPIGPALLATPFAVAGTASAVADEWKVTPLNNPFAVAACLEIALTALLWAVRPRRRSPQELAQLALAAGLVLWMWRLVPLGAILAAPLLAEAVHDALGVAAEPVTRGTRRRLVSAVAGLAVVAGLYAATPAGARTERLPSSMTAVDRALNSAPDHTVVLDDFAISGWLLWRHPTLYPVADLRGEIYGASYLARYERALEARPGWRDFVVETKAREALLRKDSPLSDALVHRLRWTVLARTPDYVLLRAPVS